MDSEVLLGHPLGGEGQDEEDGEGQTFRDRNGNKGDRDDEDLDESNTLLVDFPHWIVRAQLNEEPDYERREKEESGKAANFCDHFCERIEFQLQRPVVCVSAKELRGSGKQKETLKLIKTHPPYDC